MKKKQTHNPTEMSMDTGHGSAYYEFSVTSWL